MHDFSELDPGYLADYLAGEASPEVQAAVERWAAVSAERRALLEDLGQGLRAVGQDLPPIDLDLDVFCAEVTERIADREHGLPRSSQPTVLPTAGQSSRRSAPRRIVLSQTLRRMVWSMGTAIVAALLYVVVSYRGQVATTVTRVYATRSGQQATFTLVDGTRVTLAPQTRLQVVRFGASSRAVTLDGQAYFEVARAAGTPFLVRTGAITTQVLGTAFLIRHYADDAQVHIAVAEGKVRVMSDRPRQNGPSQLTLAAGYIGDVTDSTILASAVDDVTRETDWVRGRLVFQDVPVSQVLQTLSRWYGYQFRCSDSTLTQQNVTVALDARSSSSALAMLEQFLKVRLTVTGDTVTLTPHQGRSTKGPARSHEYDVWIPTREVGR